MDGAGAGRLSGTGGSAARATAAIEELARDAVGSPLRAAAPVPCTQAETSLSVSWSGARGQPTETFSDFISTTIGAR